MFEFSIDVKDIGRYVRRKSTGLVGPIRRDSNGWLIQMSAAVMSGKAIATIWNTLS